MKRGSPCREEMSKGWEKFAYGPREGTPMKDFLGVGLGMELKSFRDVEIHCPGSRRLLVRNLLDRVLTKRARGF